MSSTLTGTQIKNTYPSLLKLGGNSSLDPITAVAISDGLGNDTPLQLSATLFKTKVVSANKDYGLSLDLSINSHVYLGDYNTQYNGTSLYLSDYNQLIQTYGLGSQSIGLKIDFLNKVYSLGDFNSINNGTSIIINDTTKYIKTYNNSTEIGLNLDFDGGKYALGDYANVGRKMSVYVNDPGGAVFIGYNAPLGAGISFNDFGFGLNPYFVYQSGVFISGGNRISQNYYSGTNDITLEANNTSITLEGVTNNTTITTDSLKFNGAGLENPSAPPSPTPATYLVVEVNGLPYKMPLFNP